MTLVEGLLAFTYLFRDNLDFTVILKLKIFTRSPVDPSLNLLHQASYFPSLSSRRIIIATAQPYWSDYMGYIEKASSTKSGTQ